MTPLFLLAANLFCSSPDNVFQLEVFNFNGKYEMEGIAGTNPLSCTLEKKGKTVDTYLCDSYYGVIYAELSVPQALKAGSILTMNFVDEDSGLPNGGSTSLFCK